MNKERKFTLNNLVYALLFLVIGIILLTSSKDIITLCSEIFGGILIIIGIVKLIIYIYMKGKLGNYGIQELIIGLLLICCGILLIFTSQAFSFAIRTISGLWIIFAGINRMIFAITIKRLDNKGFIMYLLTSILMFVLGILIISAIFDQLIGLLLIIYSVAEIVNYIYFKINNKDYVKEEDIPENKVTKKTKRISGKKTLDADYEENKNSK